VTSMSKKKKKKDEHGLDDWAKTKESEAVEESRQESLGALPEIRRLQKQIKALNREIMENGGTEKLVRECCSELYQDRPTDLTMPKSPKKQGKGPVQAVIAHMTDTQLGKITNSYDCTVAERRLMFFAQKVVQITDIKRKDSKITDLHLYLGGDMVEGEYGNYPSQPYDVSSSVIRQALVDAPDIFEPIIYFFLKHFERIHIFCVPGNHGRGGPHGATKHNETNWDRAFYWILRDRVLGSDNAPKENMRARVDFFVPEGDQFWAFDRVLGWGNLLVHGDQIRGWAGIPFYGVQKKSHGWADSMPNDWDHLFFGHFHQIASGSINYRKWYCGGTPETDATYALEALAAAGPPVQRLCFVTEEHGIISDHPVYLEPQMPVMKKHIHRTITEVGQTDLQRMIEVLVAEQESRKGE